MIGLFVLSQQEGVNDTPFFGADTSSNPQQITINAYTYNASRMGSAPTITATIWNENCLDDYWSNSVYISFKGEKYFLSQIPTSSYSNTEVMYKHEAIFVSERVALENVYFYDVVTNDTENDKPTSNNSEFSFFGDIHQFAQRLGYSLNYAGLDYTVVVDDGISSEEKLVTFEHKFFSEVLQEAYKTYDVPYYFVGKEIHIGYTDNAIEDVFRYGANDALLSITKANANQRVINRATGLGSEHNLPYYYPNLTPKGNVIAEADDSVNIAESDLFITNPLLFAEKVEVGKPITYVANNGDISAKTRFIQTFSSYAANENRYAKEITKGFNAGYSSWTDKVCKIDGDIYNKCEEKITNANGRLFRFIPKFEIKERFWTTIYHADVDIDNVPDVEVTAKPFLTVMGYDESGKKILEERIQSDGIIEYIVPDNCASVWWKSAVSYRVFGYDNSSVVLSMDYTVESTPYWTYDNKKIELSDIGLAVIVEPFDGDSIYQRYGDYIKPQQMLMPPIYRESEGAERFYNAINDTYQNPEEDEGVKYDFENPYVEGNPKEQIVQFEEIFPTIKDVKNSEGLRIDMFSAFAYDQNDNDETELDEDGNEQYIHPYFFGKLRKLDFNLFDCALDSGEMKVSMTSGKCGACEFIIGVDKDSHKNTVQVGNNGELLFDENGNVRCGREIYQDEEEPQPKQQDTINNEVWVALKKDNSTFGVLMPNATNNYRPTACSTPNSNDGDTFVLLNISLPQHYIAVAEQKLEEQVIRFMYDNNVEKFNFSAKFSRIYFQEHPTLLALLDENSRINLEYNGKTHLLYVSSYSYKVDEDNILPEITVELKDTISVSQNAIQKAMNVVAQELNRTLGEFDVIAQTSGKFLRKDRPDTALQPITFEEKVTLNKGAIVEKTIQSKGYYQGRQGMSIYQDENGDWHIESDFLSARKKLTAHEVEIQRAYHISGAQIKSAASMICSNVEDTGDGYRCYFETTNDEGVTITNDFMVNDLAFAQTFNLVADANGDMANQFYWRKVMEVGENYILLSKQDAASGSTEPMIGDHIVQLGNTTDTTRQSAVVDAGAGVDAPYYRQYVGINTFALPLPETQLKPNDNILSGRVTFQVGSSGLENLDEWDAKQQQIDNAQATANQARDDASFAQQSADNAQEIAQNAIAEAKNYTDQIAKDLQDQLDGKVESFFYDYDPTLDNQPASEWTTDALKEEHLNDTFTNTETGRSWRWLFKDDSYQWVEIADTQSAEALAKAQEALGVANGKVAVFVTDTTPVSPYNTGDFWLTNNRIKRSINTRTESGLAYAEDWVFAEDSHEYTDNKLASYKATVDATVESLNNAIADAEANANAYTDEGKAALQASIDALNDAKANITDVYKKAEVDGKVTAAEQNALTKAQEFANVAQQLAEETAKAYADGEISASEAETLKKYQEALSEAQDAMQKANDAMDAANEAQALANSTQDELSKTNGVVAMIQTDVKGLGDDVATLNKRLDGVVENFFVEGTPSTTNYPVSEWTTDNDKINHIGDTYTNINEYYNEDGTIKDTDAGKSWRWCKCSDILTNDYVEVTDNGGNKIKLHWHPIADSDAVLALQKASQAQATADGKIRTFVVQPTPPYSVGDFWHSENERLKVCVVAKEEGLSFAESDWQFADTIGRIGENLVTGTRKSIIIPENYRDNFDWPIYPTEWKLSRPLEKGKTYTLTCQSTGEWTPNHIKDEESNGVTLWITDNKNYSVIISDWYTGTTGTTFVWNEDWNPNFSQRIRLNSYGISQRFWNLKIEEGNVATPWSPAPSEQPTTYTNESNDAPYSPKVGDMWIPSDTPHITKTYTANGWQISGDSTGTTINGGLITAGTIKLGDSEINAKAGITGAGGSDSSVRIWAGSGEADMDNAPFRVMQDGTVFANKGVFSGLIHKTPTIIDNKNYQDYISSSNRGYDFLDFSKIGTYITFGEWTQADYVRFVLPSVAPAEIIGSQTDPVYVTTEADKQWLRGLIGQTIIVENNYSTTNDTVKICFANDGGFGQCTLIRNGEAIYCTLKVNALTDENNSDIFQREVLHWEIKRVVVNSEFYNFN